MFEQFSWKHLIPLLRGTGLTIVICLVSAFFGTVIGVFVGMGKKARNRVLRTICNVYVNIFRGIPLLIILYMVYYAIPILTGRHISQFAASSISLSIYAGSYIGEIFYGAIDAIPKGQFEASDALGMKGAQKYIHVILPQAVRIMIPSMVTFLIALIKDSSLVSVIGYIDLTRAGRIVTNLTMQPFLTFIVVGIFYFILCYSLSIVSKKLEMRFNVHGR